MATVKQVDQVLNIYNREHVKFPVEDAKENQAIARGFVQQFVNFMTTEYGLKLKKVEQGSAFEELKVGKPDEFDFMLVIDHSDLFDPPTSNAKDAEIKSMKEQGEMKWLLNCYHRIGLHKPKVSYGNGVGFSGGFSFGGGGGSYRRVSPPPANRPLREVKTMVGQWPGTGEPCLSAQKTIRRFQEYLQAFKQKFQAKTIQIQGVRAVEPPEINNPALTTVLHKADSARSKISIDMSPALMFNNSKGDGTGPEYYLAKKKPALAGIDDARLQLLWLDSFSQAEMKIIQKKTTEERRNYRIVKSLFDEVTNKYIWKTIFMKREGQFPSSPLEFLTEMLQAFEKALIAEQKERANEAKRRSTTTPRGFLSKKCESVPDNLLLSKFNECENVLARYGDGQIENWLANFEYYLSFVENGEPYCEFLLTKPELGTICEEIGIIYEIYCDAKARQGHQ